MSDLHHRSGDVLGGRWQLSDRLGQGAMGEVYRGQDLVLGRPVAIKVLASDLLDDRLMLARFRREAMSSSRLVHPNIVTTLDFGVDGTSPYMVMELIEGAPLDRILEGGRRLDPQRAARLIRDVARGLEAAHRQGTIHRDIKPGNVMVAGQGDDEVARILDFGIARSSAVAGPRLTMVGLAVGTPGYIAPEQLAGQQVGPAADLFSLGVTAYEMLTGELPWEGHEPMALLGAMLRDAPRPLAQLRAGLPPALSELVMSLIQRPVADRPASAREVVTVMQAVDDAGRRAASVALEAETAQRVATSAVATASVGKDSRIAAQQLAWFQRAVQDEGGTVAQSIGREVLALLPSAEACLRLTRTHPPADVPRPSLGFHLGEVVFEEAGMVLGAGVRTALRLARLAGPRQVLLTDEIHDAVGLGWRGRVEPRGKFVLDRETRHGVFVLRGSPEDGADPAAMEAHDDGLHWRCTCGAHGQVPATTQSRMRVRCSMCSRLLAIDTEQPAAPVQAPAGGPTHGHPLTSIVLTAGSQPVAKRARADEDLISALSGFDQPEKRR